MCLTVSLADDRGIYGVEPTSLSTSVVHGRPASSNCFFFISNPHRFIRSYTTNWIAPLLTPNSASDVPRNKPNTPSERTMDEKPSATRQRSVRRNHGVKRTPYAAIRGGRIRPRRKHSYFNDPYRVCHYRSDRAWGGMLKSVYNVDFIVKCELA
jgi:hypothetical protein